MVSLLFSYYIVTINIYVIMTLSSEKLASLSEPEILIIIIIIFSEMKSHHLYEQI